VAALRCRVQELERAEHALDYRIRFERLITSISTYFINLQLDQIDGGINHALRTLGEFVSVDRSYIFQYADASTRMSNTHEWCAPGITVEMERLQDVPSDTFRWFTAQMRRQEVVHVPRVSDLPQEAASERSEWEAQLIHSLICVPMVSAGTLIGFVGFDSVREEKTWSEAILFGPALANGDAGAGVTA